MTAQAYGEESAPGFKPAGGTQKCNAIFKGETTTYKSLDGYEGATCNYLWYVQAILNHATSLKAAALPVALHKVGTVDYSYPYGPVNYYRGTKERTLWRRLLAARDLRRIVQVLAHSEPDVESTI